MAIYNGTQKVSMSGIDKIYVGTTLVYQSAPSVVSIALSGETTSLPVNSAFSFGGTVTATYSDGTTADVTSSTTFSGYDMSTAGTYTVTASYTENGVTVTTTYQLTVVAQSWHTIWSGSKSFGVTFNGNSGTTTGTGTLVSTSGLRVNVPTKITFTTSGIDSSYSKITKRGTSSGSWSVTSPQEFTSAALGQDLLYGNIYHSGSLYCSYKFSVNTASNGKIGIWIGNINASTTSSKYCDMTLKKIEQYY